MLPRLPSGHYFGASRELVRGAGLLIESTSFEPDLVIPRHEHEHAFFCLVTAGRASRQWPGRHGQSAPMRLTLFPAEQPHQNLWGAVSGDYHWHQHANDDEFFYVVSGRLLIDLEDGTVELKPGQAIVIPKGRLHRPRAPEPTVMLMVETAAIVPTGDA